MLKLRIFLAVLAALFLSPVLSGESFAGFELLGGAGTPAATQPMASVPIVPQAPAVLPVAASPAILPEPPMVRESAGGGVLSVERDRIPLERFEYGQDVTVPESFLVSASGVPLDGFNKKTISGGEAFGLMAPAGWTVIAENRSFNQKVVFAPAPGDTWVRAFGAWAGKTGDKVAISPEDRTVWVLFGSGVQVDPNKVAQSRKGEKPVKVEKPVKEKSPAAKKARSTPAERPVVSRDLPDTYAAPITPVSYPTAWAVSGGRSLKQQLSEWCGRAGYTMLWEAPSDFIISGSASFDQTFEDAVSRLFNIMYKEGRMSLKATIYKGNKIVRIRQD